MPDPAAAWTVAPDPTAAWTPAPASNAAPSGDFVRYPWRNPSTLPKFSQTDTSPNDLDPATTRFFSQLYEKSPLAPAIAAVKSAWDTGVHPVDQLFNLAGAAKDAAKAQWDQAVQAAQKAKDTASLVGKAGGQVLHGDLAGADATGREVALTAPEMFAHGLAAVLPFIGPAASDVGTHGGRGDVAGMAGGALGLLAPFGLKYGLDLKNAADPVKADLLRREATQQVSDQVLAPGNPRFKGTAATIAPQLLERGLQGSRLELQQMAENGMADAAGRIDDAVQLDPKAPVSLKPTLDAIDQKIAGYQVAGKTVPGSEPQVAALQTQRDFIASHGATLPFEDVRQLRQILDKQASDAKVYERAGNQPVAALGQASADAAAALRQSLAANRPETVGPNADFTFFKRLSDVLDPTKGRPKQTNFVPSGITGGMTTAGAVIGENISKMPGFRVVGALVGSQLLPKLKAWIASPAFQLTKAADKMKLADAIEAGRMGTAEGIILKAMTLAPRGVGGASIPLAADQSTPGPSQAQQ